MKAEQDIERETTQEEKPRSFYLSSLPGFALGLLTALFNCTRQREQHK